MLLPQCRWLWQAFETLSAARLFNEAGPQPLQFSEIIAYAAHIRASVWEADVLVRLLGKMDQVFLEHHQREREKKSRDQTRKKGGVRPTRRGRPRR